MILEATDIAFAFGGFRVLDGVSLAIKDGEIAGLIGPNGAGKSTFFAVATGFEMPISGTVSLSGRDISRDGPVARARLGLGRTFQVPREFRHLTVCENMMVAGPGQAGERLLELYLRPGRVSAEEHALREKVDRLLDFLNLARVADMPSGQLSGGQKKLLELGRVLMTEPKVVLLDEPFAGVNPVLIEEISGRIRALNDKGTAFLIVEHNLKALSHIASTIHVMDRGHIIAAGAPAEVLADARVREAYMGGVL